MLDQTSPNNAETSPRGLTLWPPKKFKTAPITNETMKVRLQRCKKYKQARCSVFVVLEEEVLDLCAGLATYSKFFYGCRIAKLHLLVVISPQQMKERTKVQASREATLLRSVMALRYTASVKVEGAAPELAQDFSSRLSNIGYCNQLASEAVTGLFSAGENAFNIGDYTAAIGYYYKALYYYRFCVGQMPHLTDTGDWTVFSFTLGQKRARSHLEMLDFIDVCVDVNENIRTVMGDFLTLDPKPIGSTLGGIANWTVAQKVILPPMPEEDNSTEEDRRMWKCERFKEAAARFKQRITCEDIGRCYMYRSIAFRCRGLAGSSSAAEDRLMSLACCGGSATSGEGCIEELLELERRMMKYFVSEERS
ncbi:MAG: hypothetical protein Q9195_005216 [Heterodermia aff. obscurata]